MASILRLRLCTPVLRVVKWIVVVDMLDLLQFIIIDTLIIL